MSHSIVGILTEEEIMLKENWVPMISKIIG
jgi:hypothetical protein